MSSQGGIQKTYKHFGYGSNISKLKMWADMRRPVGDADPIEDPIPPAVPARLSGYRLAVRSNGTATIIAGENTDYVIGMVYELTEDQMDRLRRSEGVARPESSAPRSDAFGSVVTVQDVEGREISNVRTWTDWDESSDTNQPVVRYYFELIAESLVIEASDFTSLREYISGVIEPLLRRKRIKNRSV